MSAQETSKTYRRKKTLLRFLMSVTAVSFEVASRYVPELQQEIAQWRDGFVFTFGVLPEGPYVSIKKDGSRGRVLPRREEDPVVAILCKNVDAGLMALTGTIGAHTSVVQRRVVIRGSVADAMRIQRAMTIVQTYVFPAFVLRRVCKQEPKFTAVQLWIKAKVFGGVLRGITAARRTY